MRAIGADLYSEALAEFNTAADLAGEDDAGTWWVFRLPLVVQLALLVLALQVVDKTSEFIADLAGDDLLSAITISSPHLITRIPQG